MIASLGIGVDAITATHVASTFCDYVDFISEYARLDTSSGIVWDDSPSVCASYGVGWHISGIYNSTGTAAVVSLLNGARGFFGGYSYLGFDYNSLHFLWYAGRFQGRSVSQGLPKYVPLVL